MTSSLKNLILQSSMIALAAALLVSTPASYAKAHKPHAKVKAKAAHKKVAQARPNAPAPAGPLYAQRSDAMAFAQEVAARHPELDAQWIRATLEQARYIAAITQWVLPPPRGTAKDWQAYRARFVEPKRIQAGVRFWQANEVALAKAQALYGVPAEIIMGILGVETLYGQHMGDFRVLDALATLAFDFPAEHPRAKERSAFFRNELEQFLLLPSHHGPDPVTLRGSFAGAIGLPQFMPSSWMKYAVDFDGDGKIDLIRSSSDAIGSIANYLQQFKWQTGMPTHYPVRFDLNRLDKATLLAPDILPTFDVATFTAKGAVLEGPALQHRGPLALVELHNGDQAPTYIAGTENFYAITRYNWSSYYALAVIELGQAVQAQRALDAR